MGKVRNLINIIFDTEPVYGGKYIKAKKRYIEIKSILIFKVKNTKTKYFM